MKTNGVVAEGSEFLGQLFRLLMGREVRLVAKIHAEETQTLVRIFGKGETTVANDYAAEFSRRRMIQKRGKIQHGSFPVFKIRHVHRLEFRRRNESDRAVETPFAPDKSESSAPRKESHGKQILPFFQRKKIILIFQKDNTLLLNPARRFVIFFKIKHCCPVAVFFIAEDNVQIFFTPLIQYLL